MKSRSAFSSLNPLALSYGNAATRVKATDFDLPGTWTPALKANNWTEKTTANSSGSRCTFSYPARLRRTPSSRPDSHAAEEKSPRSNHHQCAGIEHTRYWSLEGAGGQWRDHIERRAEAEGIVA